MVIITFILMIWKRKPGKGNLDEIFGGYVGWLMNVLMMRIKL